MSLLDLRAVKQHDDNQLNKASISLLNSIPCSHSVFNVGDGFQRLCSTIALPKVEICSVAMFLELP